LFATVLAIIILGETLKVYHFPAFILIIAGVYLVSRAKRQAN
jgi:drug/metabolite transporter (DMT)-like permease